jgi:NADPH-dependent 2,4-dienoyl-CoA reductase/sulfur reductase-like enzyme
MTTDARHFDVLIVGAGPAGLSAARVAADNGARVGLVDDNPHPGGQIWRQGPEHPPAGTAKALIQALTGRPNVSLYSGARIVQALPGPRLLAENASQGMALSGDRLILATGARERFLPFPGWILPGVTGAGGLQALIKGGTPVEGQRIVVSGSGPLLWAAAATAQAHGAHVVAIVEQAPAHAVARFAAGLVLTPAKVTQALRLRLGLRRTPYWRGAWVEAAHGDTALTHITVRRGHTRVDIPCDRLACGYGLLPNTRLAAALGCRLAPHAGDFAVTVDAWQATSVDTVFAAGECTGVGGMELSAAEGRIAAYAALGRQDDARALFALRERYRGFAARLHAAFALSPALRGLAAPDTIVCRCEDVAYQDLSGRHSWRDAKLQTRCGMGPCQGRICGAAAAFCFGWGPEGSDLNTPPRPPLSPTRIATLLQDAGDPGQAA